MVSVTVKINFHANIDLEELWDMSIKEYIEYSYSIDDILEYTEDIKIE